MKKTICDICGYSDAIDRYGKVDLCFECLNEMNSDYEVKIKASKIIDSIKSEIEKRISDEVSKISLDEIFDRIGSFKEIYYNDVCCMVRQLAVQGVNSKMESIVKVAKDEVRSKICEYVTEDESFKDYVKHYLTEVVHDECKDIVKEIWQ